MTARIYGGPWTKEQTSRLRIEAVEEIVKDLIKVVRAEENLIGQT